MSVARQQSGRRCDAVTVRFFEFWVLVVNSRRVPVEILVDMFSSDSLADGCRFGGDVVDYSGSVVGVTYSGGIALRDVI